MADETDMNAGHRPSRAVSLSLSAALVVIWGTVRLVIFDTIMFPLAYSIPLLVCVWTRDRIALWGMAALFAVFHTMKVFWILPEGAIEPGEQWANYLITLANIAVTGAAVHVIIILRERLENTLARVRAQAEELRAQGDELAHQNEQLAEQSEELSRQNEELSVQTEELASQNEELQTQAEDISSLNDAMGRREALLQALFDAARLSGSEVAALRQICAAALDLFEAAGGGAAAAYEKTSAGLVVRTIASGDVPVDAGDTLVATDSFVGLVLEQNRPASLDDAGLRPDLDLLEIPGKPPFRAVLCAPMQSGGSAIGAFAIYLRTPHEWTDEQFRLAEWLASQCAHVLETLRMQAALRETDRRKSEFLATLSHELRNPLSSMRFAVELLGKEGDAHGVDPRTVIERQLRHMVRLVDDLLETSRISSNKVQLRKERIDLVPVLHHAIEAMAPEVENAGHTLTVSLPTGPVWLEADPDRVAQVVTNLLNNAVRYTPAGGRITITATIDGDNVELSVSDTGVGLGAHDLSRVFDMFTQVSGPGTGGLGIGLALVRSISELHGGRVDARSDGPGQGAEFRITLPLSPTPPEAAAISDTAVAAAPRPRRILVVDDNADSAEMMASLLEMHGHEVRMAHDGEAALTAAQEWGPEVALLDIGLPDLDGYQLARRLRGDARTRDMRLLAVTGWGQDGDRDRARAAGFDAHVTKPAEPDRILQFVAQAGRHSRDIECA